jgi:hypothetical protein
VRKRLPGDVSDEDDAPITDSEAFPFLAATQALWATDEFHEPDLEAEEPLIGAALERLRPKTVRRLIGFAENKFQKMGRRYPEPWPASWDGWSDFSCPLPVPICRIAFKGCPALSLFLCSGRG